ncbi:MAG: PAS domain-containing sensor histidine kinase [Candidatus Falkowbacteria bacterium]|nr:PAS domain-containing sensor histidine kinase [Candidatus Falkowbacteria bacterium]
MFNNSPTLYQKLFKHADLDKKSKLSFNFNQIENLLANITDGVVILDDDLEIIAFNQMAADITGYPINEALNQKYNKIIKIYFHGKIEITDRFLMNILASGRKRDLSRVSILVNRDQVKLMVSGKVTPYYNENGKVVGCIIIFRDITKESEVDVMKTEFVSLASHQLRTPLTAIRWFIEELYNEEIGKVNKEQKDYLLQVIESNIRMIKLVNDLLDVSRLEAARIRIEPVPTDLEQLIRKVISDYLRLARANNCQVILKEPDVALPKINIDPSLIREVLSNLISNSIKYSDNKKGESKVFIFLILQEEEVIISVQDFGIGIPKKFQRRVFQKFFRADNVVKIDTTGTGFGLYISKLLVEASGGRIWFVSEEGKGTTFFFTLPLAGSEARSGDKGLISEEEGGSIKY